MNRASVRDGDGNGTSVGAGEYGAKGGEDIGVL